MNKKRNKMIAFLLTVCMLTPMAMTPAIFAGEVTSGSITIDTASVNHKYTAYQVFDANLSEEGSSIIFSNVQWGSAMKADMSGIYAELAAKGIKNGANNCASATEVAIAIKDIESSAGGATERKLLDDVASILAKYIDTAATGVDLAWDGAINKYKGDIADPGYYIITDEQGAGELNPGDALSRYMLLVAGDETIVPKVSGPTVQKKVKENTKAASTVPNFEINNEDNKYWNDVADYNIGDEVPFKLYGTLPTTLADYSKYKYVFHDTISDNLTPVDADADGDVDVVVKIGDDIVDPSKYTVASTADGFTVTFNDIKTATASVTPTSIVTVEYKAVLNSNAVIGLDGQENEVYLTYSNNPNWTGSTEDDVPDDDGKTVEDKVIVFTYELDVIKVDGATPTTKLSGAQFKLLNSDKTKAAKVTSGKFAGWVEIASGTELTSDENGKISIIGLDSGSYYLRETKAPVGYNSLTSDVKVDLTATTTNGQDWTGVAADALTAIDVTANGTPGTANTTTGIASIDIANNKGITLPSTGGTGTTIFYILGAMLVVGSGATLVIKKRMNRNEE